MRRGTGAFAPAPPIVERDPFETTGLPNAKAVDRDSLRQIIDCVLRIKGAGCCPDECDRIALASEQIINADEAEALALISEYRKPFMDTVHSIARQVSGLKNEELVAAVDRTLGVDTWEAPKAKPKEQRKQEPKAGNLAAFAGSAQEALL